MSTAINQKYMAKKTIKKAEGDQTTLEEQIEVAENKATMKVSKKPSKKKPQSIVEEFQNDEEVKRLVREMQEKRMAKIDAKLKEVLTPEDWEDLKEMERIHNRLFVKGRIEMLERGTHYDNAEFGVKIYGDEFWFSEKETQAY